MSENEKSKKLMVWEKWSDPYQIGEEEELEVDSDSDYLADEEEKMNEMENFKPIHMILGAKGLTVPNIDIVGKLFNLWIIHTNFHITEDIGLAIVNTDGVEAFRPLTPYRAQIAVGKVFNAGEVINGVNTAVKAIVKE